MTEKRDANDEEGSESTKGRREMVMKEINE
jgi:hypothetical protein